MPFFEEVEPPLPDEYPELLPEFEDEPPLPPTYPSFISINSSKLNSEYKLFYSSNFEFQMNLLKKAFLVKF